MLKWLVWYEQLCYQAMTYPSPGRNGEGGALAMTNALKDGIASSEVVISMHTVHQRMQATLLKHKR